LQETTPLKHNLCLVTEISPDQSMSQAISDSGAKLLFPQMNKFP